MDNDLIFWLDQRYNRIWSFWRDLFYPNFGYLHENDKRIYIQNFIDLNYFCHFTSLVDVEYI